MIGSFLTRALVLVLGYAYPAYECFKIVELNKPEIEHLRFWCQYWILVAALTVFERVGDTFISWVPMYSEAKLAFFVYLWYPKTKGTAYVYDTFFRPYVAKHENEIDRNLLELKTWAGDNFILYWQKAANYGQTRFFEVLEYVAAQSTSQSSRPRPAQQRQQPQQTGQALSAVASARQPTTSHQPPQPAAPGRQPAASHQPPQPAAPGRQPAASRQPQQPARAPSSPTKTRLQEPTKPGIPQPAAPPGAQTQTSSVPVILRSLETPDLPALPAENKETVHTEVPSAPPNEDSNLTSQETLMEEVIRVTRGRVRRKAAGAAGPPTH